MRIVILVLALLGGLQQAAGQSLWPCKISGVTDPVLCYGTEKLVLDYTGNAITVQKQSASTTQDIGFLSNGAMNTTGLDAFIGADTYAKVNRWYDQIGSCNSAVAAPVQAPWIGKNLAVGAKRAIVFSGGTDVGNVHGLDIDRLCLFTKGITAKDYTVFIVARPTSSMYRNQAFTPGIGTGTFLSLESAPPFQISGDTVSGVPQVTNISPPVSTLVIGSVLSTASNGPLPNPVYVGGLAGTTATLAGANAVTTGTANSIYTTLPAARIYSNGIATPGGLAVSDLVFGGLAFEPGDMELETGAVVLAVTSNATGVKIWQNENTRTLGSRSSRVQTVTDGFIGRMGLSAQTNITVPGSCVANPLPCGPFSLAGDFYTVAVLVYNYGMTPPQRAMVSASLYERFGMAPYNVRSNPSVQKNFVATGDSIVAGYSAFGRFGMISRLQDQLPNVRFGNYAMPGSQVTVSVGTPACCYNIGQFPLSIAPVLNYSKQKNAFFLLGGGNDMIDQNSLAGNVSVASPGVVTRVAHGLAADMRVQFNTGPLPTPLSIGTVYYVKTVLGPNTYTLAATPGGAAINTTGSPAVGVTVVQYTKTAASIFAGIQQLATLAANTGAKVFVSTVLPRTGNPYLFVLDATNVLIRAGAGVNYELIDLAGVPCLSDPTGACYDDGTHPSDLGMQTAADAMFPQVNTYFGP